VGTAYYKYVCPSKHYVTSVNSSVKRDFLLFFASITNFYDGVLLFVYRFVIVSGLFTFVFIVISELFHVVGNMR